ncbi:phosphotransferase enzyme family protein [Ampelomyces quisqualis]|uniref:Phosphotransferase enzyme family protein n=1 Tax=Ampelomyces quisqualis TaxID=50730 RepID=A0A6A5R333_AMPQU|nr:phosphotransferase enzyme family protein [Ampelomyces quisqualis]
MPSALLVTRYQSLDRLLHALPYRHRVLNMKFRSFGLSRKTQATSPRPKLLAETAHGIDERIPEMDLYRYTRQRWLMNEQEELAKRYLRFDLPQLLKEAVAVCKGAQHCIQVLKCVEGLHNKAFLLMMDNGAEIFAKLPNPNAGPAYYTTSSEVATRQMLRDVFSIPVPRVLAWSCDAGSNSVQAEYILEEKVPGVRLGAVWFNLPWATKLAIIDQVAEFDASLSAVSFKKHGCVYFKEDLQRLTGHSEAIQIDSGLQNLTLKQYAMGPLTKAELWNSARDQLATDRGPWTSPQAYTRALGANEKAWIKNNAKPRMNYYRSPKDPELPQDAIELLEKYEQVAPILVPAPNDESPATNVLWHPDLHLDNLFVDPVSHKITGIVDWQSAVVAPLFYQCGVHRAFRYHKTVREGWIVPEKPTNFDMLGHEEQKQIETDLESETIHKYYELQTRKRVPLHWDVLQRSSVPVLRKPVWLVTGVWENRDLFFLRDSLITLVSQWDEIFEGDIPCPIKFSTEELELHAKEEENVDVVGKMLSLLQDQGVLPADGMVRPEDYSNAVENCHKYREVFLAAAQTEEERDLYSKLWPYQEHFT